MAKKILKGAKKAVGAILGINTKKSSSSSATTPAPTDAAGKPIITQLGNLPANSALRKQLARVGKSDAASTILGVGGTLGG